MMNRDVAVFQDLCAVLGSELQTLHPSARDHWLTDNIVSISSGRPFLTLTTFSGLLHLSRPVCCQIAGKLKCSLILQHQKASHPLTNSGLPGTLPGCLLALRFPQWLCQDHLTAVVWSPLFDLRLSWCNWYFWCSSRGVTTAVTGGILYVSFNHRLSQISQPMVSSMS